MVIDAVISLSFSAIAAVMLSTAALEQVGNVLLPSSMLSRISGLIGSLIYVHLVTSSMARLAV